MLDSSAEKQLTSLYHRFIGSRLDFDKLVYKSKKLIIDTAMVGELNILATLIFRLARTNRLSRDFTLNRLRQALIEIVACFPVYRTYIDSEIIREEIFGLSSGRWPRPNDNNRYLTWVFDLLRAFSYWRRQPTKVGFRRDSTLS